jgi:hypothetical protein
MPASSTQAFAEYVNAEAKAAMASARTPPAPPSDAQTREAATYLMLSGESLLRLLTMIVAFQLRLVNRFGNQFTLSESAFFGYGYRPDGSSFWVLPTEVAFAPAVAAVHRPAAVDGVDGGRVRASTQHMPHSLRGFVLQMLDTLRKRGQLALGVLRNLLVYCFPVNAKPQLCENGNHVCQAMQKVLRRSFGMVPTNGGMFGTSVLIYLCCDIYPSIMKPTALDDQPGFFRSGQAARTLAVHCLEFFAAIAAEFGLQLVINTKRGLQLLDEMFGATLYKQPVAAGDVGYTFELDVHVAASAGGGTAVRVRGYGTKHPCWWWILLLILAFYRAQVSTRGTADPAHPPMVSALVWAGTAASSVTARSPA